MNKSRPKKKKRIINNNRFHELHEEEMRKMNYDKENLKGGHIQLWNSSKTPINPNPRM